MTPAARIPSFSAKVKALIAARKAMDHKDPLRSQSAVKHALTPDTKNASPGSFDNAMSERAWPHAELLEETARVLSVDPAIFYEYRLWQARQMLDPSVVGLDDAVALLEAVQATFLAMPAGKRAARKVKLQTTARQKAPRPRSRPASTPPANPGPQRRKGQGRRAPGDTPESPPASQGDDNERSAN